MSTLHDLLIVKKNFFLYFRSPLYLYTVLFSSDTSSPSLERMSTIAQKYLPQNSLSQTLRCQFTKTIDEVALTKHFTSLAISLRDHKPSLLKRVG